MTKFALPNKKLAWPIAWPAVVLIAQKEGLYLEAYQCQAGVWTIFYGETEGVYAGMRGTKEQADQRLLESLTKFTAHVLAMCKRTPNANQLGALVSLAYNIGLGGPKTKGGLFGSTVLRQFNAGNDTEASRAFGLYNMFTNPKTKRKEESNGLTARRAAEAALYLAPVEGSLAPTQPMPQAVAAESSLATSPIAQSGAVTAGAGALTLLSTVKDNADAISGTASVVTDVATQAQAAVHGVSSFLGVPFPYLLAGVLLAAGVAILVHRYKQRQGGWA